MGEAIAEGSRPLKTFMLKQVYEADLDMFMSLADSRGIIDSSEYTSQEDLQNRLVREIGEVKAELSGLKAEVAGTNQRLDDIVITQLKDHGKRLAALDVRIAALEAAENKRAGGLSVLAGVAAAAGSLGALIMKFFTL